MSPGPQARTAGAQFYRYRTADGRTVIVDSLSNVPPAERAHVERVTLPSDGGQLVTTAVNQLDWPSFAAGFGLALVVGAVLSALFRRSGKALAGLLAVGLLVAGSGAYLGLIRRSTGQGQALLASPQQVIDDAKKAVEQMKDAQRTQEQTIRDIQKQAP